MTNPRLSYQTVEFGSTDIHLCTLRNKQEFHDPAGVAEKLGIGSAVWPLFGIIWPSSMVLAHFMADYETGTKRVLEIGCGMALSSLLLNKRHVDITATDHHPEVERFLQRNTLLNKDSNIAFERVGWGEESDNLGLFDLIIGSDVLYEDEHAELLANFIDAHANRRCDAVIVDPGRHRKNKLSERMLAHGFAASEHKPIHTDYLEQEFKGHILQFER